MGSFPLTENGFGNLYDNPQERFASQLEELRNDFAKPEDPPPLKGPMWVQVRPSDGVEEVGETETGLIFDDEFSGIIDVEDDDIFDAVISGVDEDTP